MPTLRSSSSAGSLSSAINYAEKWNEASDKKLQLEFEELNAKQNIVTSKITREMKEVERELSKLKKTKPSPKTRGRRASLPVLESTKKVSFSIGEDSTTSSSGDEENVNPKKKRTRSGKASYAERSKEGRIDNLHRRYTAQLNSDAGIEVAKIKGSARIDY